ncbi:MAG TPA: sodium:solute symporter family protein [bacterium]|nr:sodium:solute symporter family protein [bacterium]HPN33092.1 sodium:solute symporter family protein [bacterium]
MFGLTYLDVIMILIYFAAVILIGVSSMRRIKNKEDYFLGGRRFGKLIQTFAAFGQATSTENVVGVTTTTFHNGASGIWSAMVMLFSTPMYWITSPWFRRLRLLTMGDFFEERYRSRRMAAVYAIIGCICMMANIAIGLSAMTKTIVATLPKTAAQFSPQEQSEYDRAMILERLEKSDYASLSETERAQLAELRLERPQKFFSHLSESVIIWVVCLIVVLYAVSGGLQAAFLTDLLQGILIIGLSFLLLPFAYVKINQIYGSSGFHGALQTIHRHLPESFFDIFGSPASIDFTWYYIAALALMSTINVVVAPNMLVATGSAKDEYTARVGFTSGNFMKRLCTIFWGMFGLAAVLLYRDALSNSDLLWGFATVDLLGPVNLGLVGLMIASLMAALMSTATCLMVTASSLILHNLYRPFFRGYKPSHDILVGRITGVIVIAGGALIATQFDNILQMLKFTWEFNVVLAASFWLGMKWRKANRPAAWSSILSTMLLFSLMPIFTPVLFPGLRSHPHLLKMTNPAPLVRTFTAHEMDVAARQKEIAEWEQLGPLQQRQRPRPQPLQLGESFSKTDILPQRSIFWTQGVKKAVDGTVHGAGMLNLELLLVDTYLTDLSLKPYAWNETLRVLIRTVFPFLILMLVARFTRQESQETLDRFYVKMKTQVQVDPKKDAEELARSYENPKRFESMKLLRGSDWEFYRWKQVDSVGFLASVGLVFVLIGIMFFLVSIGG